ncbi:MAG TPA: hypothetical protein VFJ97_17150 [Dermatophilaceae bacterium]|nr:hypothetical protein [Dermatophilaceae bacterium]
MPPDKPTPAPTGRWGLRWPVVATVALVSALVAIGPPVQLRSVLVAGNQAGGAAVTDVLVSLLLWLGVATVAILGGAALLFSRGTRSWGVGMLLGSVPATLVGLVLVASVPGQIAS